MHIFQLYYTLLYGRIQAVTFTLAAAGPSQCSWDEVEGAVVRISAGLGPSSRLRAARAAPPVFAHHTNINACEVCAADASTSATVISCRVHDILPVKGRFKNTDTHKYLRAHRRLGLGHYFHFILAQDAHGDTGRRVAQKTETHEGARRLGPALKST
jgi:hypothetical protein